jgi:hypothetical protein
VPSVRGGVLWPDKTNKLFYLFGGTYEEQYVPDFKSLWYYDTIYDTWNTTKPDRSQEVISWPYFGSSAVTDDNVAYYYGGILNNATVKDWKGEQVILSNLVSYDMKTNKWSNDTVDRTARTTGNLHYIPASKKGLLVYFGGWEQAPGRSPKLVRLSFTCKISLD